MTKDQAMGDSSLRAETRSVPGGDEALKVSEVLVRAADLLEKPGAWIQHSLTNNDGTCWCVVGAIQHAARDLFLQESARRTLARSLALESPTILDPLPDWNDDPARTQAEVVTALREAARSVTSKQEGE